MDHIENSDNDNYLWSNVSRFGPHKHKCMRWFAYRAGKWAKTSSSHLRHMWRLVVTAGVSWRTQSCPLGMGWEHPQRVIATQPPRHLPERFSVLAWDVCSPSHQTGSNAFHMWNKTERECSVEDTRGGERGGQRTAEKRGRSGESSKEKDKQHICSWQQRLHTSQSLWLFNAGDVNKDVKSVYVLLFQPSFSSWGAMKSEMLRKGSKPRH